MNEVPVDRLTTTDATGKRLYVYQADYEGFFRNARTKLHAVLLIIFLGLPWIRIGGHQAFLLDLPRRRFSLFGVTFWAHDAPMFFFVLAGFVLTLLFATAVWGRVWCGWACPQTVFIDFVFRRIENWIEGSSSSRRKLDNGPWNTEKWLKKSAKWTLFIIATLIITHSFLAYFVGTDELAVMVRSSPLESPGAFLTMLISSIIVLFDFGWFREQFCTIACPYGRFQSVLLDDRSMIVGYDAKRGEPRGKKSAAAEGLKLGDCVNCYRCVQVCPTGIDIRRGLQMECIACTACMDACDDQMTRLKRPTKLIRYTSMAELQGADKPSMSTRAKIYLAIIFVFAAGLGTTLSMRKPLHYQFVRFRGAPYEFERTPDGTDLIVNHYQIDLSNHTFDPIEVRVEATPGAVAAAVQVPESPVVVAPGITHRADVFIRLPKSSLSMGRADLPLKITAIGKGKIPFAESYDQEIRVVGPFN